MFKILPVIALTSLILVGCSQDFDSSIEDPASIQESLTPESTDEMIESVIDESLEAIDKDIESLEIDRDFPAFDERDILE